MKLTVLLVLAFINLMVLSVFNLNIYAEGLNVKCKVYLLESQEESFVANMICYIEGRGGRITYVDVNKLLRLLGIDKNYIAELLDSESGQVRLSNGITLEWSLMSRTEIPVIGYEGTLLLAFIAGLITLGAVKTLIKRRYYTLH